MVPSTSKDAREDEPDGEATDAMERDEALQEVVEAELEVMEAELEDVEAEQEDHSTEESRLFLNRYRITFSNSTAADLRPTR